MKATISRTRTICDTKDAADWAMVVARFSIQVGSEKL
jgi:hypothetical protein